MTGPLGYAHLLQPVGFITVVLMLVGAILVFLSRRHWSTVVMLIGSSLAFVMQVLSFVVPHFRSGVESPSSDQLRIVASGPTVDPHFAVITMMVGMLAGLLFAIGLVAFAFQLRRGHVGT